MSTLGSPSSVFYLNGDGSIQEFKAGAQPGITFHYPRKSYDQLEYPFKEIARYLRDNCNLEATIRFVKGEE